MKLMKNSCMRRDKMIGPDNSTSKWHAGLRIDEFPGPSLGVKIANAAASIGAGILSPDGTSNIETGIDTNEPFTTKDMIRQSHELGMEVKPWTVSERDRLNRLLTEHFFR